MNCLGCKSENITLVNISDNFNIVCCNKCQQEHKGTIKVLKNYFIKRKTYSNIDQTFISGRVEEIIEIDKKRDIKYIKKGYQSFFHNTILVHKNTLTLLENLVLPNVYGTWEIVNKKKVVKETKLSQKNYIVPALIKYLMSNLTSENIYALIWIVKLNKIYYKDNKLFNNDIDVLVKIKTSILELVEDKIIYVPFTSITKLLNILMSFCKVLEEPYMFNHKPSKEIEINYIKEFLMNKYGVKYNFLINTVPPEYINFITQNFQYYLPHYMLPYFVRKFGTFDMMMIPLSLKFFSTNEKFIKNFKHEYDSIFKIIYDYKIENAVLFRSVDDQITFDMFVRGNDFRWLPFILLKKRFGTDSNKEFAKVITHWIILNIKSEDISNIKNYWKTMYEIVFKKYMTEKQQQKISLKLESLNIGSRDYSANIIKFIWTTFHFIFNTKEFKIKTLLPEFVINTNEKFITYVISTDKIKKYTIILFRSWINSIKIYLENKFYSQGI